MLLLIDTAGDWCRVALGADGQMVAVREEAVPRGQGERLFDLLAALLADPAAAPPTAVAVHCGPGGFTGLRAGIAAATGLAAGYGIPLIGVTADELTASDAAHSLETMMTAALRRKAAGLLGAKPLYALPPRATPPRNDAPRLLADPQ